MQFSLAHREYFESGSTLTWPTGETADLRTNDPQIVHDVRDRVLARFVELEQYLDLEKIANDFDIRPNRYYPLEGVELAEKAAADLGEPA